MADGTEYPAGCGFDALTCYNARQVKRALSILSIASAALAAVTMLLLVVSVIHPMHVGTTSLDGGSVMYRWGPARAPGSTVGDEWVTYQIPYVLFIARYAKRPAGHCVLLLHLLPLLLSALPAMQVLHWLRRWRPVAGICPKCGYDLRATPERCPECGEVPCRQSAG